MHKQVYSNLLARDVSITIVYKSSLEYILANYLVIYPLDNISEVQKKTATLKPLDAIFLRLIPGDPHAWMLPNQHAQKGAEILWIPYFISYINESDFSNTVEAVGKRDY